MAARKIVAIGGSAGGLEAVRTLVGGLHADLPAALLLVLHTGRESPRLLDRLIGERTSLIVRYAKNGDIALAGHLFVAPPDHHLIITANGSLQLVDGPKVRYSRPSVDVMFRSAAESYGADVVAVVLSGGDADGTDGMRAVKAAGGINIVQEPSEAIVPSMPVNALTDDDPHYCLPVKEMAPLLARLVA